MSWLVNKFKKTFMLDMSWQVSYNIIKERDRKEVPKNFTLYVMTSNNKEWQIKEKENESC